MGQVKDLRRRQRAILLKERRLRRQGQLPAAADDIALQSAYDRGYKAGRKDGSLATVTECLEKAKDFKTAASIRKSLGAIKRRITHA